MPLDIDRYAHVDSPIQRWDPRFKVAALGVFIFAVALLNTLPLSLLGLLAGYWFIRLSALPFAFIVHGLKWVVFFLVPFFLILPFTYPGVAAFEILGLDFSWQGLRLAALIFIKAVAIVLTTYSIFGSARFDVTMVALQHLKCPSMIVQMLLFTYRYTFVFVEEMRRMDTAMRARGFVKRSDLKTLKVVGNFVGTLLVRSLERTERVYKAMLSKGYNGKFHTMVRFSADRGDGLKALVVVGLAVTLFVTDHWGKFAIAIDGWY